MENKITIIKPFTYINKLLTLESYISKEEYPIYPPNHLLYESYLKSRINYCGIIKYEISKQEYLKKTTLKKTFYPEDNLRGIDGLTDVIAKNQKVKIKEEEEIILEP